MCTKGPGTQRVVKCLFDKQVGSHWVSLRHCVMSMGSKKDTSSESQILRFVPEMSDTSFVKGEHLDQQQLPARSTKLSRAPKGLGLGHIKANKYSFYSRPSLVGWVGGLEAIALRLEAIPIRLEAIASSLEAIALRLEAIAIRVEAIRLHMVVSHIRKYQNNKPRSRTSIVLTPHENTPRHGLPCRILSTRPLLKVLQFRVARIRFLSGFHVYEL